MFKPMQPSNADLDKIIFPCEASKKIDGEKLIIKDGIMLGRSMKPIKNQWLIDELTDVIKPLGRLDNLNLEGEIQVLGLFSETSGVLSSHHKEVDFVYNVFDDFSQQDTPYIARQYGLKLKVGIVSHKRFVCVDSVECNTLEEVLALHAINAQDESLDGTIVRSAWGRYKNGRSTPTEGYIVKLKDFDDCEVIVIGYEELMRNTNEAKVNPLGRTERSSAKAGLVQGGTLGALVCTLEGVQFNVGTGFTARERQKMWKTKESLIGRTAKIKYMGLSKIGCPRHPVFLGFRDEIDIGE